MPVSSLPLFYSSMYQPESVSLDSIEQSDLLSSKVLTLTDNLPNNNCLETIESKVVRRSSLTGRNKELIQTLRSQLLRRTESVQDVNIREVRLVEKIRGIDGKEELKEVIGVKLKNYTGHASLFLPTGRRISSDWVQGQPTGKVTINYPAGFTYYGPLVDFKRHGMGELMFDDGWRYYGQFEQGNLHGQGTLYNPKEEVIFSGQWLNNQPVEE